MFSDVPSLYYLYLDMNNISYIEHETFENHKMLKILSMKGNKIRDVHWNIFQKIKILDLGSNMLNGFKSSLLLINNYVRPFTEHFIQVLLLNNNNISHPQITCLK